MSDSAEWLRNLARNYADGVPGMKPEDHNAWHIAAEIERLRADNTMRLEANAVLYKDNERQATEIERLRTAVADLERALTAPCPYCGQKP
jgi:hypothetical protein